MVTWTRKEARKLGEWIHLMDTLGMGLMGVY